MTIFLRSICQWCA